MSRRLVFALVVLAASAAGASDAPGGPAKFVQALYKSYGVADAGDVLGKRADGIFSAPLLAEIRADQAANKGEVGKLDYDPICACQESDGLVVSHLKVLPLQAGRARAEVVVGIGREQSPLTLDLVKTPKGWRVDDVSTAETPSLRRFLASP